MRTFGVEEELLLVDEVSGEPLPLGQEVVDRHSSDERLTTEFQLEQAEIGVHPHESMEALSLDIKDSRASADTAARAAGARVAALATSPLPVVPHITPQPRYEMILDRFGITTREQLTCGCHVHVSVDSDEEGVAVLDRIRAWLPVLAALSANSPFWNGTDTGYASFRSQAWGRIPTTGPNDIFGSAQGYHEHVQGLLATGIPMDEAMMYFDARLSRNHPTVEIRLADVCLDADTTVLLAALVRALVETASHQWNAGESPQPVSTAMLRLAGWQASRWGIESALLHPLDNRPHAAGDVITALLEHVRPALIETGDESTVEFLLGQVLAEGTGSRRQHAVFQRRGQLSDVVIDAISITNTPESSLSRR